MKKDLTIHSVASFFPNGIRLIDMTIIMKKMKTQVARKRENLVVALIILFSVFSMMMIASVQLGYTQQQVQEQQLASDGGLTATLNGETFTRGDPVTVRGTVGEKEGGSRVYITIVDPDGIEYGTYTATVTNNLTFTFGFIAGQPSGSGETKNLSMDKFGTYTIMLMYALQDRERVEIETTDVSFEYVSGTPTTGTTTAPPPTTRAQQPQGVEIILMQNGTGVIVDNSSPNLPQNRATFNWTQTGGSPIRFENSTIILER